MVTRQFRLATLRLVIVSLILSYSMTVAMATTYAGSASAIDDIPLALGWQPSADNLCQGFYQEPIIQSPQAPNTIQISANQTNAPLHDAWHLIGNVNFSQDDRHISADEAFIKPNPHNNNKHDLIDANRHVRLREPGLLALAEQGNFNLSDRTGQLYNVVYRIGTAKPQFIASDQPQQHRLTTTSFWGTSSQFKQQSPTRFYSQKTTFSSCPPTATVWHIDAKRMTIDRNTGRGQAWHSWLYVGKQPLLYTPYIDFPIDDRRKSGFLPMSVGVNSQSGFNLKLPYYFNLAPNYDLKLTPQWLAQRGVLVSSDFRYLTQQHNGEVSLGILPGDNAFKAFKSKAASDYPTSEFLPDLLRSDNSRKVFAWHDIFYWSSHLQSQLDYNWSSDNYWLNELGALDHFPSANQNSNQLIQALKLNIDYPMWHSSITWQHYLTLERVDMNPISRPYNLMPRIETSFTPPPWYSLQTATKLQYTNFSLRQKQPYQKDLPITANRFWLAPEISLPWQNSYAYLTPSLTYDLSFYDLQHQNQTSPSQISRTLPIWHLDSGLFFDKSLTLGNHHYKQTLEPRLALLYIPFRDQDNIPNFDSGLLYYRFDSLFGKNRFSGIDRIGDSKQLALGATTRFIDQATGIERLYISVGELLYYDDRKVAICYGLGCQSNGITTPKDSGITQGILASEVGLRLNQTMNVTTNYSYDQKFNQPIASNTTLSYQADQQHIINLGYHYSLNSNLLLNSEGKINVENTRHASVSLVWPMSDNWLLLTGAQKNLEQHYMQDYLTGIEYNSCCWAFRVFASHTFAALDVNERPTFNKAIYLQWELKGLGAIGLNDPSSLLRSRIPYYLGSFRQVS